MAVQRVSLLQDTVQKLVRRKAKASLAKIIFKSHPAEIAQIIEFLLPNEGVFLLEIIVDPEFKADIVSHIENRSAAANLLMQLDNEAISKIFTAMSSDDAAEILAQVPDERSKEIINLMEDRESLEVEKLLEYPEQTAGRIMSPNYFALQEDITAQQAIEEIQQATEAEMVFYIYVINEHHHLLGVLSLRQLLTVGKDTPLKRIMNPDVVSVRYDTDQEEVARLVARYNLLAVPVVDEKNMLLGIVTVDDVIDVIKEEATEDILKIAGTAVQEIENPSVLKTVRFRFPWLMATWFGGVFAAYLISAFETTLEKMIILSAFFPIINGMGGNVGSQTLTTVVRGLATGRIDIKQIWNILFRELRVGLLLGMAYGLLLGFIVQIQQSSIIVSLLVGGSICASMFLAAIFGVLLPMFFEKFHIDPAIASGPFVTTFIDIVAIGVYLSLANVLIA